MTAHEAIERLNDGGHVQVTIEEGHVLEVHKVDQLVVSECIAGWCAGVVEAVCAIDSDYLTDHFFANRKLRAA